MDIENIFYVLFIYMAFNEGVLAGIVVLVVVIAGNRTLFQWKEWVSVQWIESGHKLQNSENVEL